MRHTAILLLLAAVAGEKMYNRGSLAPIVSGGRVTPIFEKQRKQGSRIDDDGEGRSHRLYLYRR